MEDRVCRLLPALQAFNLVPAACVAAVAMCFFLPSSNAETVASAGASAPVPVCRAGQPDLYRATGGYVRVELILDKAQGNGSLFLFVHGTADGAFTTGWVRGFRSQRNLPYGLVAGGLRHEESRIHGVIKGDAHCPEAEFEVEAQIQNGRMRGTYEGYVTKWKPRGGLYKHEVSGKLRGQLVTEAELRRANALAAGRDYPCSRGPTGGGTAIDCGQALVRSFADARLVWKSEENYVPGAWGANFRGIGRELGNYGGVVVADDRVYAYYSCPVKVPADAAETNAVPARTQPHVAWTRSRDGNLVLNEVSSVAGAASMWTPSDLYDGPLRMVKGIDRVLRVDAATGRTLWRASWPAICFGLKSANHTTPCVADGLIIHQQYATIWQAAPEAFEQVSPYGRAVHTVAAKAAPAAIVDGRYFARLDGPCMGIACYDLRTTEEFLHRRRQEHDKLISRLLEVLRTKGRAEWQSCFDVLQQPHLNATELNALKRAGRVLAARAQDRQDQDNRYAAALRLAALAMTEFRAGEAKAIRDVAVPVLREMVTFGQRQAEARRALRKLGAEPPGRRRPSLGVDDELDLGP